MWGGVTQTNAPRDRKEHAALLVDLSPRDPPGQFGDGDRLRVSSGRRRCGYPTLEDGLERSFTDRVKRVLREGGANAICVDAVWDDDVCQGPSFEPPSHLRFAQSEKPSSLSHGQADAHLAPSYGSSAASSRAIEAMLATTAPRRS